MSSFQRFWRRANAAAGWPLRFGWRHVVAESVHDAVAMNKLAS